MSSEALPAPVPGGFVQEELPPSRGTPWAYILHIDGFLEVSAKEPGIFKEDLISQSQRYLGNHPSQWLSTLSAQ